MRPVLIAVLDPAGYTTDRWTDGFKRRNDYRVVVGYPSNTATILGCLQHHYHAAVFAKPADLPALADLAATADARLMVHGATVAPHESWCDLIDLADMFSYATWRMEQYEPGSYGYELALTERNGAMEQIDARGLQPETERCNCGGHVHTGRMWRVSDILQDLATSVSAC